MRRPKGLLPESTGKRAEDKLLPYALPQSSVAVFVSLLFPLASLG